LQQISTVEPQSLRQLNSAVPADLETIVLKALSKSREERYGTAGELAADLRRFLDGRPTVARRPTSWDRAARWVSRRARLVVAAILVLTFGFAGAASLAVAFARMQQRTEDALADAQLHLLAARKTVDDFGARLSEQLADVPGAESVRLETLERAQQFYEEFLQYAGDDRRWQRDVAVATAKRASVLQQLGKHAEAELAYRKARQLLTQFRGTLTDDEEILEESAWCDYQLGLLLTEQGPSPEGCQLLSAGCYGLQALARRKPDDARLHDDLIRVRIRLAEAWRQAGEPGRAKDLLSETVAAAGMLVATDPENVAYRTRMASALNNLAALSLDVDPQASGELFCQAAGLLGDLVRHEPNNLRFRSEWGVTLNNQAMLAEKLGRLDESLGYLDQALNQQRIAYEQSQSDPRYGKLLKQHEDNRDRILRKQDGSRRIAESHPEVEGST
jgi:tetratricopeptide (TPR) repeat protein